jgi:hypothetical protein
LQYTLPCAAERAVDRYSIQSIIATTGGGGGGGQNWGGVVVGGQSVRGGAAAAAAAPGGEAPAGRFLIFLFTLRCSQSVVRTACYAYLAKSSTI